jgi:hypothetical protein
MKSFDTFYELFTYLNTNWGHDWRCSDVGFEFTLRGMTGWADCGIRFDPITDEDDFTFKHCVALQEAFNSQNPRQNHFRVRLS